MKPPALLRLADDPSRLESRPAHFDDDRLFPLLAANLNDIVDGLGVEGAAGGVEVKLVDGGAAEREAALPLLEIALPGSEGAAEGGVLAGL